MDDQNIQNQDMSLLLTSDAKPRLKWTLDLHKRFVDAVTQLGGPEKATPKPLMKVMNINGLTLYHLKSHLQKYRLRKIQQSPACSGNMQEVADDHRSDITSIDHNDENTNQINEGLKIAQALQMQMEVQRKLHEQIEVQRRLQLRIEAQGRYLHSVLKKAQETLAGYDPSGIQVEVAKSELSQLVSMMNNGCPSSFKHNLEENPKTKSSLESSLTSSESSERSEKDNLVLSSKEFDLNSQFVNDFDFESKSNILDLNSK